MEWYPVYYNGLQTNVEVTKCGRVRKVKVDWMKNKTKYSEIDLSLLKKHRQGYYRIKIQINGIERKTQFLHQLIASTFLGYNFGNYPRKVVDHIDNNPLNNCVNNLQIISQRENCSRLRTQKSGLPVGVVFNKEIKKYKAQIYINKKVIYLGCFNTIEEASQAYQIKLKSLN